MQYMKEGDRFTVTITKLAPNGSGIAECSSKDTSAPQGVRLCIPYTAPGDVLIAEVTAINSKFAEAKMLSLLKQSPMRASHDLCEHYGSCGGCQIGHITASAQLASKQAWIHRLFNNFTPADYNHNELNSIKIIDGPVTGYRYRAQFFRNNKNDACFRARASHETVPIKQCPILAGPINNWLLDAPRLLSHNKAVPERFTVTANNEHCFVEGIHAHATANILDKNIIYSPECFFQSNHVLLEKIILEVCNTAEGKYALDIYAGVGLFAGFIESQFEKIDCVEASQASSRWIAANCSKAGVYALPAETWVTTNAAQKNYDYVVIDPPRNGLSKPVQQWLIHKKIRVLSYVSCNPETLARDARILCNSGYKLDTLKFYDFYPHTIEMEAYARFIYNF